MPNSILYHSIAIRTRRTFTHKKKNKIFNFGTYSVSHQDSPNNKIQFNK